MNRIKKMIIYVLFISMMFLVSCNKIKEVKEFNINELQKMSKLSTLKCSFKNVMVYEVPGNILGFPLPNEKVFLEYNATVNLGIDMKDIKFDSATNTITIPKAEIIGEPNFDETSFKEHYYKRFDWASNLNINVVQNKFKESLIELKGEIEKNDSIMNKAQSIGLNEVEALIKNVYTVAGRTPKFKYVME